MTPIRAAIARDPADRLASAPPVAWAVERLRATIVARGGYARVVAEHRAADDTVVTVAGFRSKTFEESASAAGVVPSDRPEALALLPGASGLLAGGADARGMTYAVLELADRVRFANDPFEALQLHAPIAEQPANAVRSVARLFCSEV